MGALVRLAETMFPIDADRLRAGLEKLQRIRDGVPGLVTPYEAKAILATVARYEAMTAEADAVKREAPPRRLCDCVHAPEEHFDSGECRIVGCGCERG